MQELVKLFCKLQLQGNVKECFGIEKAEIPAVYAEVSTTIEPLLNFVPYM